MHFKRVDIPDGIKNEFDLIGRGFFSYAYRQKNVVYLRSKCIYKEAMALFTEEHKNLPYIESLYFTDNNGFNWYRMPYYQTATDKDYLPLKALHQSYVQYMMHNHKSGMYYLESTLQWLETIQDNMYYEPIRMLVECTGNYDETCKLEITKQNISKEGNDIIFRDIIYSHEQLTNLRLVRQEQSLQRKLRWNDYERN